MKMLTILCIFFLVCFPPVASQSLLGLSLELAASVARMYDAVQKIGPFNIPEPCQRDSDITGLELALRTQLYGQHLATTSVLAQFKGHLRSPYPSKPLVLAFHGAKGVGKSFVSRKIAESVFEKGMQSAYVHLFMPPVHFPHKEHVGQYQQQLQDWVKGNITLCSRSIFIFDEVDKMHPDILNSITSFINNSNDIKGGDFNSAIYILLSNLAYKDINKYTYDHLMSGKKRNELQLKEMQDVIVKNANKDAGGLWHSEMISKGVISAYIPFLPLELEHIKECIRTDIRVRGLRVTATEEYINSVVDEMPFQLVARVSFSDTGCKTISDHANYVIERDGLW